MNTKKDYIAPKTEITGDVLLQMVAASPVQGITGGNGYDIGWGGEDQGEHDVDANRSMLWDEEDEGDNEVDKFH